MTQAIQQINETTYITKSGNTELTLQVAKIGGWYVMANNPSTRAWKSSGIKFFHTLQDVEAKYKGFRGISNLVEMS